MKTGQTAAGYWYIQTSEGREYFALEYRFEIRKQELTK